MSMSSRLALGAIALLSLTLAAPVGALAQTGPGMLPMPPEHAQAIEAQGGLYDGPMAAYVAQVGDRAAQAAGKGGQCGFHVINNNVVNAFTSPPGCHVYISRGLLGLLNNEAELAATLGHEVGHVTANHAGRRQQREVITGLGALILGAVTKSQDVAKIASQVGQLNVLSYSRDQEFEADSRGVQYTTRAGYSPYGLAGVLQALQRDEQFETKVQGASHASVPSWARTHPLTSDRIARAVQAAKATGAPPGEGATGAQAYLNAVDGMVYGDDASQGFVQGRAFAHPGLRIGFQAPMGFTLTNGANAVSIAGSSGKAQFTVARLQGRSLEAYTQAVLSQIIGRTPVQLEQPARTRINGLEVFVQPALARTAQGDVELVVATYATGPDTAYQFVTQSLASKGRVFDPMINSLHQLSAAEVAALKPRRIEVVTVRAGDSIQSLAQRMAFEDNKVERFNLLNGLQPTETLKPGRRIKLVTVAR